MKPKARIHTTNGIVLTRIPFEQVVKEYEQARKEGLLIINVLKAAGGYNTYPDDSMHVAVVVDQIAFIEEESGR